jgi:hypothetical protein
VLIADSCVVGDRGRIHIRGRNDADHPGGSRQMPGFSGILRTLDDAKVAFRSGTECLKRFLVSLAFVSREGNLVAVEFDKYRPLLQFGFVNLNLARGPGQKTPAE